MSQSSREILFGGSHLAMRDSSAAQDTASAVRILEQAFVQLTSTPDMREVYGDPNRGASLVQAWRTAQIFGTAPRACLLISGRQGVTSAGIEPLIMLSSSNFVRSVCQVASYEARASVQLFTYDGRTGHCVTMLEADPSGIKYHDPWPGDSLLTHHQNVAGVDAQRAGELWHISTAELAKVAVAAFVSPAIWTELTGRPGRLTLGLLESSDLWSFFNLSVVRAEAHDPTYVKLAVAPGAYREHIDMNLTHNENGFIGSTELALREAWILGPPWGINPFARDIAVSWLRTFLPESDRIAARQIVEALSELRLDEPTKRHMEDPEWLDSCAGRASAAYLGLAKRSFAFSASLSFLTIETQTRDGAPWTRVSLVIG